MAAIAAASEFPLNLPGDCRLSAGAHTRGAPESLPRGRHFPAVTDAAVPKAPSHKQVLSPFSGCIEEYDNMDLWPMLPIIHRAKPILEGKMRRQILRGQAAPCWRKKTSWTKIRSGGLEELAEQ